MQALGIDGGLGLVARTGSQFNNKRHKRRILSLPFFIPCIHSIRGYNSQQWIQKLYMSLNIQRFSNG